MVYSRLRAARFRAAPKIDVKQVSAQSSGASCAETCFMSIFAE